MGAGCCCECQCSHCSEGACCFLVTIAGIAAGSCGTACLGFNIEHRLPIDDGPCLFRCINYSACDAESITLRIVQEGGDYIIRVDLGPYRWEKNYGASKPACRTLSDESLGLVAGVGECDASGATCKITGAATHCNCGGLCTRACTPPSLPQEVQVTFDNVPGGGACCGQLNGNSYILQLSSTICAWSYEWPRGTMFCDQELRYLTLKLYMPSSWHNWFGLSLRLTVLRPLGEVTWGETLSAPQDCTGWNMSLPWQDTIWSPPNCAWPQAQITIMAV